jgi:hypothetical protein
MSLLSRRLGQWARRVYETCTMGTFSLWTSDETQGEQKEWRYRGSEVDLNLHHLITERAGSISWSSIGTALHIKKELKRPFGFDFGYACDYPWICMARDGSDGTSIYHWVSVQLDCFWSHLASGLLVRGKRCSIVTLWHCKKECSVCNMGLIP